MTFGKFSTQYIQNRHKAVSLLAILYHLNKRDAMRSFQKMCREWFLTT